MKKILNISLGLIKWVSRLAGSTLLIIGMVYLAGCKNDTEEDQAAKDQAAYDAADAINGGQLYDKFWKTNNYTGPVDPSVKQEDIEGFSNFYRCKQCHGWDQEARFGWYINRAPKTSRPDVSAEDLSHMVDETDLRDMFEEVAHAGGGDVDPARTADGTNPLLGGNDMPDFSKILTEAQIWDLVKFLKEGQLDTENLYDLATSGTYPTGSKTMTNLGRDGSASAGDAFYTTNCASCHGTNGTNIALEGKSLGDFARGGPHETQHKAKNGHPGSSMKGLPDATETDIKNLLKALADETKYPSN